MSAVITALRFRKGNRDRVDVYLDGRRAVTLPAVEAANLYQGQVLSEEEIERLKALAAEAEAYERTLRFLGYRPRSIAEVRRYLQRRGVEPGLQQRIIDRLQAAGYLDDRAFARFWVENRQQFNPRGAWALRHELRAKGVSPEIVEEALATLEGEEETAYQLARARVSRWRDLDRARFWQRAGGFLTRRGFSHETVRAVLERLWDELQARDERSVPEVTDGEGAVGE